MKITYQKISRGEKPYFLDKPIHDVLISDPTYDNEVACRYERNNLNFNLALVMTSTERILDEEDMVEFTITKMLVRLSTIEKLRVDMDHTKTYDIGVDTGEYTFMVNGSYMDIQTACDGYWGKITEIYDKNGLSAIQISLIVPEHEMSLESFVEEISQTLGIPDIKMVVSKENQLDIDISNEPVQKGMELK